MWFDPTDNAARNRNAFVQKGFWFPTSTDRKDAFINHSFSRFSLVEATYPPIACDKNRCATKGSFQAEIVISVKLFELLFNGFLKQANLC